MRSVLFSRLYLVTVTSAELSDSERVPPAGTSSLKESRLRERTWLVEYSSAACSCEDEGCDEEEEEEDEWGRKDRGDTQGDKEPKTRTKHSATIMRQVPV